jgi:hypothetical protein
MEPWRLKYSRGGSNGAVEGLLSAVDQCSQVRIALVGSWIRVRIRIRQKSEKREIHIRIRINVMRIRNTSVTCRSGTGYLQYIYHYFMY